MCQGYLLAVSHALSGFIVSALRLSLDYIFLPLFLESNVIIRRYGRGNKD